MGSGSHVVFALKLFEPFPLALVVVAVGVLAVAALPRLVHGRPMSFPIPLVGLGALAFGLPIGLPDPDPLAYPAATEHLTEIVVIVALTNAGLRIDRRVGWRAWMTTWRLLGYAMPLTVAAVALTAHVVLGVDLPAAVLLGAAVAPTDPVLAAEVQVGGPGEGSENLEAAEEEPDEPAEEDEVRFGLTSEAGLNDALAFPYTNLAVALALAAASSDSGDGDGGFGTGWLGEWVAIDVVYKLAVGLVVGIVIGRVLAKAILAMPASTKTGKALTGVAAVAVTFAAYGTTEAFGGYGFLATFIAAHVLRHSDADHEYHASLVVFVEQLERLLIVIVLLGVGGYLVRDLQNSLTSRVVVFAAVVVLVVRPLSAGISLLGGRGSAGERAALAFYGIRGVGSFYYLAYAMNEADFESPRTLWTAMMVIAVGSLLLHGLTASTVLKVLDEKRVTTRPAA
ncbi:MAG TPA: cation:proton antiporter [Acidimicrobiales bacterium]|nr:cation:proton antiporter [Acidimicrobiales bacterium]